MIVSHRAIISIGSNLGQSLDLIHQSILALRALSVYPEAPFLQAPVYRTPPLDCPTGSPDFLNTIVILHTELLPRELLKETQNIEAQLGRPTEHGFNAPRTIDLDLIAVGNLIICDDALKLPHPRAHQREFVLRPLADLLPDIYLPGSSKTVAEQLESLGEQTAVRLDV